MNIVDFKQARMKQMKIKSIGSMIEDNEIVSIQDPTLFIHGPTDMDCLNDRWSKKEVLGIIGGSGSGKTALVLEMFRHILMNSQDPNSIVIFVSLEMTTANIAKRWQKLVGPNSPLSYRLYVVSNYEDDGRAKCLTTAGILNECAKIKSCLGVEVESISVDHVHIIEPISGEDVNQMCKRLKEMAVQLNAFVIMLSQTTKGKEGEFCDKPLDQDASYGNSAFKTISTHIITIHRPLAIVQAETDLRVLSWGYVKIREQHKDDKLFVGQFQLLHYDLDTGHLRRLTKDEMFEFSNYYALVRERKAEREDAGELVYYNTKVFDNGKN
jgi:energy-coupling factor transporter ATP-binding protein EcfA2